MTKKHNNLKRIVRRSLEELRATYEIAKMTSLTGAFVTLVAKVDIQRMNRNGYHETDAIRKRLKKKHEVMLSYFERQFASFLEQYDFDRHLPDCDPGLRDRIWLCWWQGEENAPELVKACTSSVCKNKDEHTVTVITEANYKEYVRIPEWVEEKYRKGIISKTHFSDLLRFFLLAEYGGIWLDASIYCTSQCFDNILNAPIWSIKRPGYNYISVASGYFATYSFACQYEHRRLFMIVRDFLLEYWRNNNILIDYLMLDYLIVLAQKKDKSTKEVMENVVPNNPACDELLKVLDKPFDECLWEQMKKETFLFKLTWKKEFPESVDGIETFYGRMKSGTLL